jgi:hypothetical protein
MSHIARRTALGLAILIPYVFLAWRSPSKAVARPYIIGSAVYLLMLFVMLPTQHLRYFLPFCLIVGWSVAGFVELFGRPLVRGAALTALFAVNVVPSFSLVKGLSETPPPVAALAWVRSSGPAAILYSGELQRHATYYWPEGDVRREPRTQAECDNFRQDIATGTVFSTIPELCRFQGRKIVSFKRDARVHDKHHLISIFAFGPLTSNQVHSREK